MPEQTLEQFADWADRKSAELTHPDHREALELIRADLGESLYQSFQGSRDPDGAAWRPLKTDDPFAKPLIGKGTLLARLVAAHRAALIDQDRLEIHVDTLAAKHNLGRNRPKREFLGFSRQGLDVAAAIVAAAQAGQLVKD